MPSKSSRSVPFSQSSRSVRAELGAVDRRRVVGAPPSLRLGARSVSRSPARSVGRQALGERLERGAASSSASRKGFCSSICSTSWCSSSVDSCSRRIDCCNCGVSARCCESRTCSDGLQLVGHELIHPEVFAEIDLAHVGVLDDLGRRAFGQHPALADDVGAVADAERLAHVVVGDQHADAALLEEADDALDLDHRDRVDAGERLVEQDEARLRRQRARDLDPPPLAARQRRRRRRRAASRSQVVQQAVEQLLDRGACSGLPSRVELQLRARRGCSPRR